MSGKRYAQRKVYHCIWHTPKILHKVNPIGTLQKICTKSIRLAHSTNFAHNESKRCIEQPYNLYGTLAQRQTPGLNALGAGSNPSSLICLEQGKREGGRTIE